MHALTAVSTAHRLAYNGMHRNERNWPCNSFPKFRGAFTLESNSEQCLTLMFLWVEVWRRSQDETATPRGGSNPYTSPDGHNILDIRFCKSSCIRSLHSLLIIAIQSFDIILIHFKDSIWKQWSKSKSMKYLALPVMEVNSEDLKIRLISFLNMPSCKHASMQLNGHESF